jgi:hypothetical protein
MYQIVVNAFQAPNVTLRADFKEPTFSLQAVSPLIALLNMCIKFHKVWKKKVDDKVAKISLKGCLTMVAAKPREISV